MIDAIYIHIPFCKQKCHYCDFCILTKMQKEYENYVNHIITEISLYGDNNYSTVYFGGGTPSVLSAEQLKRILSSLKISENSEITLEMNPGDMTFEKLVELRKIGFNRLSIGVQSFDDEKLLEMNRSHNSKEAITTYYNARKAGFDNISLDLIFALPNQTFEQLKEDLKKIIELKPDHISIYSLIWEDGTMFMKRLKQGRIKKISEDLETDMYLYIIDFLQKNGYEHYEFSSFCKDNKKGEHNKKYWKNMQYVGVGLGASGYIDDIRYTNYRSLVRYYQKIDENKKPIDEKSIEIMDDELLLSNEIILGLRMLDEGVKKDKIESSIYEDLYKKGYLYTKDDRVLLTKKGLLLSNEVFMEFIK